MVTRIEANSNDEEETSLPSVIEIPNPNLLKVEKV